MKIIHYSEQTETDKAHWREEIQKADWGAAKYLYTLLNENRLIEMCGQSEVLLLTYEHKLVSFCTLAEHDEIRDQNMKPWIGFVYTFEEHRGNRYSQKLIDYCCELARKAKCKNVYISSDHIGLYEKYGFVFIKNTTTVWGENTQVFCRKLDL